MLYLLHELLTQTATFGIYKHCSLGLKKLEYLKKIIFFIRVFDVALVDKSVSIIRFYLQQQKLNVFFIKRRVRKLIN